MKCNSGYVIAGIFLLLSLVVRLADASEINVPRLSKSPTIDGLAEETVWLEAATLSSFVQTYPSPGAPSTHGTEVRVGFDSKAIYFAIRADDDPSHVRATLHARDDLGDDDLVALYLDTFGDRSRAYVLRLNPLGVQQDGIFFEGSGTDLSADIDFRSAGQLTPRGWEVEVGIPFESLRFPSGDEHHWRLHILRQARKRGEESSWRSLPVEHAVRFPVERTFLLSDSGTIRISDPLEGDRCIEVTPSLVADWGKERRPTSSPAEGADWATDPLEASGGITASLTLGPNVSIGAAYRPEFGEIEDDPPVLTANNPFPIYFAERRPFFLEGLDLMRTLARSVDTRQIQIPESALKGTWQGERASLALLAAHDKGSDPGESEAGAGALRYRYSLGSESWIGGVLTTRSSAERENSILSADGRFRLGERTTLAAQISGSMTEGAFYDPSEDRHETRRGTGFGYAFDLDHQTERTSWRLSGIGFTPDYRADLGYIQRTDSHRFTLATRYSPLPRPDARLLSWAFLHTALFQTDSDGKPQFAYVYPRFELNFPGETYVNLALYADYVHLVEEEYGPRRAPGRPGAFFGDPTRTTIFHGGAATVGARLGSAWSVEVSFDRTWNSFDYDFGAGPKYPRVSPAALTDPEAPLDPGSADGSTNALTVSWLPNERWLTSFSFVNDRLVRNDNGRVALDSKLASMRIERHFSRSSFARLRIDYDSLTGQAEAKLLLTFRPKLGTAVYVGYEGTRAYNGFNLRTGVRDEGWIQSRHSAFVKLSYSVRRILSGSGP